MLRGLIHTRKYPKRLLLGCVFAGLTSPLALADEPSDTPPAPRKEVGSASESLNSILHNAGRLGVLNVNGPKAPASDTISAPAAALTLPPSCEQTKTLNFSDLKAMKLYSDFELPANQWDVTPQTARELISLGLGLEAYLVLKDNKAPEAKILQEVALLLDRHKPEPSAALLRGIKACNTQSLIWASLATPTHSLENFGTEDIRSILQELTEFPPNLREQISLRLGILAAESGQDSAARRIWIGLDDFAREYDRISPEKNMRDYGYIYLKGLISETDRPEKALAAFTYISQRDNLYRPAALKRVQLLLAQSGDVLPQHVQQELIALGHQYSGRVESREANLDLISFQAQNGNTYAAMAATKASFSPHDREYDAAVNIISERVNAQLTATPLPIRIDGLNTYLSDPDFFQTANLIKSLKYNAMKAAMDAHLPELWKQIYTVTPTDENAIALLIEAQLLVGIKQGELQASITADSVKVLMHKIDHHIRSGEIANAKTVLKALPAGQHKSDYELQIAWLERKWDEIAQHSKNLSKPSMSEATPPLKALDPKSAALADLLATPSVKSNGKVKINTMEQANEILSDINKAMKTAQEYIDNG